MFTISISNSQYMDFQIPFEKDKNTTAEYHEVIAFYNKLASNYSQLQVQAFGMTDSGFPLHVAVLSGDEDFSPESILEKNKRILLINNAIHPGEPCGVDASMLLLRDYLQSKEKMSDLNDVVIVVIPYYNIGGGLNRGSFSRTNQNGPEAYGFRGNAKNLDLNRDFIKCDSKNAQTFNQIFNRWQPDVFVDTHTSNGADYQYTMTIVPTQHNKLAPELAGYLKNNLLPKLYKDMESRDWPMTPYVYARRTPDTGIAGFPDIPRYSSGYAALHHTLSFMSEAHMLKPFQDRVRATYELLDCMVKAMADDGDKIKQIRGQAFKNYETKEDFDLNWEIDTQKSDTISFKGYTAKYKASEVSGQERLYYDQTLPYDKKIPHYDYYKANLSIKKPKAYLIPQAYSEVLDRLRWNGVEMHRLKEKTEVPIEMYSIKDYETTDNPYEGHYLHSKVKVETQELNWTYHKGDYVVFTDQVANRFIVETLEPQAPDSYFAWNFFDGILGQKEYFSSYVFEDMAADMLVKNPELKEALEARKQEDEKFAKSARAQLDFIYKRSPHYEKTHKLYPVGRLMTDEELPLE
ncbi:MAG: M14 family metallopeptidase [Bacteroidetes bacterium]|nr:M14 family metallopeptidase [Bacteroidota bacterium]